MRIPNGVGLPVVHKQENDVLSGGAGGADHYHKHPGNKFFRMLRLIYAPEYKVATAKRREQIAYEILVAVSARGGRFLTLTFHQAKQLWLWKQVTGAFLCFAIQGAVEQYPNTAILDDATTTRGPTSRKDPLGILSIVQGRCSTDVLPITGDTNADAEDEQPDDTVLLQEPYPLVFRDYSPNNVEMKRPIDEEDCLEDSFIRDFDERMRAME